MGEPTNVLKTVTHTSLRMICVQYVYFIVNFVFVIMGTVLMATASVIGWIPEEFSIFLDWDGESIGVVKLIGISLLILSLIANYASIRQSFILFSTYGALLLALLTIEVNLAIKAFITYDTCDTFVGSNMLKTLENYYYTKTNWDYLQHYLHCCGIHNSSDWVSYHVYGPETTVDGYTYTIPYSCCRDLPCNNIYSTGCLTIVSGYVSTASLIVLYTTIGIGFLKLWVLVFSCILTVTSNDIELQEEIRESQQTFVQLDQPYNQDLNAPSSSHA